jgi:hypothetical protein
MINKPKYLWVRPNSVESPLSIVNDPIALFRGAQFDETTDKLYQIGQEVQLKVSIDVIPTKRESTDLSRQQEAGRTAVQDTYCLKGGLGVGDYRG